MIDQGRDETLSIISGGPMEYKETLYEKDSHIATVTLNRPERRNAWTFRMREEVYQALKDAESDAQVRVIIITGAGTTFCAGADVSILSGQSKETAEASAVFNDWVSHFTYPQKILKPIIVALNGPAIGWGFTLIMFYDIRIAAESAKLSVMYPRRGLAMEGGASWMLPRLVGWGKALELAFTARTLSAKEALDLGILNHVVPDGQLMAKAREIANEIAENCSPVAVAEIKREIYEHLDTDLPSAIRDSMATFDALYKTEDFKEGIRAMMQKRAPKFPGKR
jgi:enoyl-CoA hydratase/carnithine racemase